MVTRPDWTAAAREIVEEACESVTRQLTISERVFLSHVVATLAHRAYQEALERAAAIVGGELARAGREEKSMTALTRGAYQEGIRVIAAAIRREIEG